MNIPSPAPKRQRRQMDSRTNPLLDLENDFHQESYQNTLCNSAQEPVHDRVHRDDPADQSTRKPTPNVWNAHEKQRRKSTSFPSFLDQLPIALRIVLISICVVVFFTCAVSITLSYLSAQEERRLLEAEAAERAQHPLVYADLITQYAAAQDLDPALVCAIILCESSFNPEAVSYLGARGLMQTMPDTAEWIAHKLDEDASYSFDNLFDPETNIRYGTWYLGYLTRRFDGDATKVVCAYHAGQGNVDAWLKNPAYSRDGVTLDVIPTDDTATYASRVLRARDVYRKYYFPAATAQPPVS